MRNKYARKYCRQVKKWLPGMGKYRQRIMERIYSAVKYFVDQHPEANYNAVEAWFGTPQQIAAEYVAQMDTREMLKSVRFGKRIITLVTAVVAALVLLWGLGIAIMIIDAHNSAHGYMEVVYSDGRKGVMVEWEE